MYIRNSIDGLILLFIDTITVQKQPNVDALKNNLSQFRDNAFRQDGVVYISHYACHSTCYMTVM